MGYNTDVLWKFKSDTTEVDSSMDSTQKSASTTGAIIEATMVAALIKFGTEASKVAMEFEQEMAKVQATSGATADEMVKLEGAAREMGATTEWSAIQAAEAMNYLALAGMDTNEITEAMPAVLDMATAAQIDLALAADIATDTMTMFGYEAAELTGVMDIYISAQQNANLSTEQLFESLKMVGPAANAAGQSLEEMAAMTMVLADAGLKGSAAGTAMNAIFTDMKKKVDGTTLSFGDFTVEMYDTNGEMRSMIDIMRDIEAGTENMTQANKDAALSNIFSTRSLKAVNIMLDQGVDALDDYADEMENAGGTSAETAAIMRDTTATSVMILKSAFTELMLVIGEFINFFLRPLIDILAVAVGIISALPKPILYTAVAFGVLATAMKSVGLIMRLFGSKKRPSIRNPYVLAIMAVTAALFTLVLSMKSTAEYASNTFNVALDEMANAAKNTEEALADLHNEIYGEKESLEDEIARLESYAEGVEGLGGDATATREKIGELNNELAGLNKEIVEGYASGETQQAIRDTTKAFEDSFEDILYELEYFATKGPEQYRTMAAEYLVITEDFVFSTTEELNNIVTAWETASNDILEANGETWGNMSENTRIELEAVTEVHRTHFQEVLEASNLQNEQMSTSMNDFREIEAEEMTKWDTWKMTKQKKNDDEALEAQEKASEAKLTKLNESLAKGDITEEEHQEKYENWYHLNMGREELDQEEHNERMEDLYAKNGAAMVDKAEEEYDAKWWQFKKKSEQDAEDNAKAIEGAYSGTSGTSGTSSNSGNPNPRGMSAGLSSLVGPMVGGSGGESVTAGAMSSSVSSVGGQTSTNYNNQKSMQSNSTYNVYPQNWSEAEQMRMKDMQNLKDWNKL